MQGTGKNRSEFWKRELERFSSSGLTAQAYCAGRGLGYSSFCGWRRRLLKNGAGDPQVVTIPVISPRTLLHSGAAGVIRVDFDGTSLSLPASTDARWLASLLIALQSEDRAGRC